MFPALHLVVTTGPAPVPGRAENEPRRAAGSGLVPAGRAQPRSTPAHQAIRRSIAIPRLARGPARTPARLDPEARGRHAQASLSFASRTPRTARMAPLGTARLPQSAGTARLPRTALRGASCCKDSAADDRLSDFFRNVSGLAVPIRPHPRVRPFQPLASQHPPNPGGSGYGWAGSGRKSIQCGNTIWEPALRSGTGVRAFLN